MLNQNEIVVGNLYAWDVDSGVSEPDIGCNLFTITRINENGLIDIESLDGIKSITTGTHCLISRDRALKRLKILHGIDIEKEADGDSHKVWKYNRELKYLEKFASALREYENNVWRS